MIFIQTDENWPLLQTTCLATWCSIAKEKGYTVQCFNYTGAEASFIDNLIIACEQNNLNWIIIGYDDLFFHKFSIPSFDDLDNIFKHKDISAIRLDGRRPARGVYGFKLNNVRYYNDHGKYQLSTVFSAFSYDLLIQLKKMNILTAWQIEKYTSDKLNVYAPKKRLMKYNNMIVKGKIDPFTLLDKPICITLFHSLTRIINRRLSGLIRIFR